MLSAEERSRYSRHLLLPQVGEQGQARLKASSVLVIGAGGLGSPVLLYLAAAGVGRIGVVDFDDVDVSNLQRQVLYETQDVGRSKLDVARDRIQSINPYVELDLYPLRLTTSNAIEIIDKYDVVADGTDNFATRYLVNDACVLSGTPNVFASIFRFDGQVAIFGAPGGPCYRCIFPEPPPPESVPNCAEGGVLGVLPGMLGTMQATEVIKLLLGIGEPLIGKMLIVDALSMNFRTLKGGKDPECSLCGERPTQEGLIDYEAFCSSPSTETPTLNTQHQDHMFFGPQVPSVSVIDLKKKKDAGDDFFLLDVRQPEEQQISDIGGHLIPMDQLADRLSELEAYREKDIIVMCRTGSRSAFAVQWLQQQGFKGSFNLEGGIVAWSRKVDSSVSVY